jgi:hypothetical protein
MNSFSDDDSVSSAGSFSDDDDDDEDKDEDGDIEINDGFEYDGFEYDEQHNPPSVGNSTVDDGDTEQGANASTEELYQQCLTKIAICLALHPPEVRAAAISFVNSIKDGGVVIWTRSSAILCKLAMKLRKDSNIIVLMNKCATFKGISAACGGICPPSMDPLDCASMKVIAAFDKCFGDASSYKFVKFGILHDNC